MFETITEAEVEMNREERQQIARTIMSQIGRRKLFSLRAANFMSLESGVQFKVITGKGVKINKVVVKLTASDDYTVEFWNVSMKSVTAKMIKNVEGVYCDVLGDVIMSETRVEEIVL